MKKVEEEEIVYQKSENLESEKSFLCEIRSFSYFQGLSFGKIRKKGT